MTKYYVSVVLALVLVLISAGQGTAPPLEGMTVHGCTADGYVGDQGVLAWHVHTFADYADGHLQTGAKHGWIRLYAIRATRERAMKDCDEWMESIDKLQRKPKKKR